MRFTRRLSPALTMCLIAFVLAGTCLAEPAAGESEKRVRNERFVLTGWGGGKPEEVVPQAAGIGCAQIVVHHDNAKSFTEFIRLGREHNIDVYAWMFLGDRAAWKKAYPDVDPPMQVMNADEMAAFDRLKADKTPDKSGYQWGGEPHGKREVLLTPLMCFHDPRVLDAFKKQMDEMLAFPGVAGIAFDYVGYQNYTCCRCPTSLAQLAAYRQKHPELSEEEARKRFSLETLVDFNNQLSAYIYKVKPDAKVMTHVYPVYLPEPLYGNRLDLDECCQTAAWFFEPFWSTEKITSYSRIIVDEANRYHKRPVGAGLIGVGRRPAKSPERLLTELSAILAGGCTHVHVCALNEVLKNPESAEVFKRFFTRKADASPKVSVKWSCPMHPQVGKSEKGRCPICGMNLIPVLIPAPPAKK